MFLRRSSDQCSSYLSTQEPIHKLNCIILQVLQVATYIIVSPGYKVILVLLLGSVFFGQNHRPYMGLAEKQSIPWHLELTNHFNAFAFESQIHFKHMPSPAGISNISRTHYCDEMAVSALREDDMHNEMGTFLHPFLSL